MNQFLRVNEESNLADNFRNSRQLSETICESLAIEDYGLQAMPETSPAKWHLAHTTWFYETFILRPYKNNYQPFSENFEYLFNSYYNGVGNQFKRSSRGLLSRPTVAEVYDYRRYVNQHMLDMLAHSNEEGQAKISERVLLGIHHEQQHQELLLTDLKYCFYQNPIYPALLDQKIPLEPEAELHWNNIYEGLHTFGNDRLNGFCFDNETPCHQHYLGGSKVASRLVTNGEYLEFIRSGGYQNAMLWLSDGWAWNNQIGASCPLYWQQNKDGSWHEYTLYGMHSLDLNAPICHVNLYEADAFAKWYGCRLPTEYEWEHCATQQQQNTAPENNALQYHPGRNSHGSDLLYQVWQWTSSSYTPYPGFKPLPGAIGEYNGKFMCNQMVLRGGSCLSSANHVRNTYRNFFYPSDRWQMSGIRLAKDMGHN